MPSRHILGSQNVPLPAVGQRRRGCYDRPMITAINKILEHEGKKYHLQVADLGEEEAAYAVRVYNEGAVVWMKRLPYAELEAKKLPKVEHDSALRAMMEKTLVTVGAAIARGKIG